MRTIAKKTTATPPSSAVLSVLGNPEGEQVVILAKGAHVPPLGGALVLARSDVVPDGVLGVVVARRRLHDGSWRLTLEPGTIDDAYSSFSARIDTTLGEAEAEASALDRPKAGSSPVATASSTLGTFSPPFTCHGAALKHPITTHVDLSDLHVIFELTSEPFVRFLLTGQPRFDLSAAFTGEVTCTAEKQVPVPIAGTGVIVDIGPKFSFDAHGDLSADFAWTPHVSLGYVRARNSAADIDTHVFRNAGSVSFGGDADADFSLALETDVTLAGRVGVGGTIGPDVNADVESDTSGGTCLTATGSIKADLEAFAHVLFKNWTFTLYRGSFGKAQLYRRCNKSPAPGGGGSGGGGTENGDGAPGLSGNEEAGRGGEELPREGGDLPWHAIEAPVPTGGGNSGFTYARGACSSDDTCIVGGTYQDSGGDWRGMIDTLSDGSWSSIEAPVPAGGTGASPGFDGAACSSGGTCVMAGSFELSPGGPTRPMIDTLSGGSWSAIEAPVPVGGRTGFNSDTRLEDAACASGGTCILAGEYLNSAGERRPMIDTLSDGSWSSIEAPVPAGGDPGSVSLDGEALACASGGTCILAGEYLNSAGERRPMIDTLSDGSWSSIEAPVPAGGDLGSADLVSVSPTCSSDDTCVVAGAFTKEGGDWRQMIDTLSDGSWSSIEAPVPAGGLDGPACFSGGACIVAGSAACSSDPTCVVMGGFAAPGGGEPRGMIDTLSDGSWSSIEVPVPAGGEDGSGRGSDSACSAAGTCVVESGYQTLGGEEGLAIDTLSGGSWTSIEVPVPAGGKPSLDSYTWGGGAACSAGGTCVLAGNYQVALSGQWRGMILVGEPQE